MLIHSIVQSTFLVTLPGPEHVLPTAFRIIPTFLASKDWRQRYAALSAIGTLAESSAQLYKNDLDQLMRYADSYSVLQAAQA